MKDIESVMKNGNNPGHLTNLIIEKKRKPFHERKSKWLILIPILIVCILITIYSKDINAIAFIWPFLPMTALWLYLDDGPDYGHGGYA